jgi:hypothetical protein
MSSSLLCVSRSSDATVEKLDRLQFGFRDLLAQARDRGVDVAGLAFERRGAALELAHSRQGRMALVVEFLGRGQLLADQAQLLDLRAQLGFGPADLLLQLR